jgi:cystathionine beta-lyase
MVKLLDNSPDRRDGESVKWNFYPRDVLPMWVADMDVRSPQPVIDALQRRVSTGVFG